MSKRKIAVIGLGYVGLPLAVEFGKIRRTIGFDINESRISALKKGFDQTLEISADELKTSREVSFTSNIEDIKDKVPGKWRTCEIDTPDGNQVITVEIVDKDKNVLTRFQEYK